MKIIGISQCYDENSILEEMLKFPTPLAPPKIHRSFPIHVLLLLFSSSPGPHHRYCLMYPKFLNCLLCTAITVLVHFCEISSVCIFQSSLINYEDTEGR